MKSTSRNFGPGTSITNRFWIAVSILMLSSLVMADTTITYQGQLRDASGPVNGTPGMEFRLFDSLENGSQVGSVIVLSAVPVTDGLFQVELDFGNVYGGDVLFLEVTVDGQTLDPRQPVTSAPVAVHALSLDSGFINDRFWQFGGNAGTSPGSDFLGTTDAVPFELRVGQERALRIEPLPDALPTDIDDVGPNIIGGYRLNRVEAGAVGATISGGGAISVGTELPNVVSGDSINATIGGGFANTASATGTTIAGGGIHTASDLYATVGGGKTNTASGVGSTVGGGQDNTASGELSTIGGGEGNLADGKEAAVGGGKDNAARATNAVVGGGNANLATGENSTIGGGFDNVADSPFATLGGGDQNNAIGYSATVGGGAFNTASGQEAVIAGGISNVADAMRATVAGGDKNSASINAGWSAVGGGLSNVTTGEFATIPGGRLNSAAGDYSFAVGRRAAANHDGAFVWADSTDADFASGGADQFIIRASGGVGINTDDPWTPLHIISEEGQAPLRVMVGDNHVSNAAIRAYGHQGVAIGRSWGDTNVPARGLRVFGQVRIGDLASGGSDVCITTDGTLSQCSSSARYKDNITPLESARELLGQLRAVEYEWIESGRPDIGLIAEEVAEVIPEIVTHNREGEIQGIEYSRLSALLIAAFQEQEEESARRFAALEAESAGLEQRVSRLSEKNAHLQQRLADLEALVLHDDEVTEAGLSNPELGSKP